MKSMKSVTTVKNAKNVRIPHDGGSVLILALLVTIVILALGITAMWVSSSGMKMSGNITRRQEAMYAAEAGLDHARAVLNASTSWTTLLAGCGSSLDDTTKGKVLCESGTAIANYSVLWASSQTLTDPNAKWMDNLKYTVYIRNDDAETADTSIGANTDSDKRVAIRSEGVGRDGLSYFAIETIVSGATATATDNSYCQAGGCSAQNTNAYASVKIAR
jgi:Tfp pilus assembly protein PilX